jgi:hypothetical protein
MRLLIGLIYWFKNMNIIHFPISLIIHPSPLKSCDYGGNFTVLRCQKLEFVDEILIPITKRLKRKLMKDPKFVS